MSTKLTTYANFLWMDKYQPASFKELTFHPQVNSLLKCIASSNDFPNLVFYGPEGAGKKTRIRAFLREIYGSGVSKLSSSIASLEVNSTTIEYQTTSSMHHIG